MTKVGTIAAVLSTKVRPPVEGTIIARAVTVKISAINAAMIGGASADEIPMNAQNRQQRSSPAVSSRLSAHVGRFPHRHAIQSVAAAIEAPRCEYQRGFASSVRSIISLA